MSTRFCLIGIVAVLLVAVVGYLRLRNKPIPTVPSLDEVREVISRAKGIDKILVTVLAILRAGRGGAWGLLIACVMGSFAVLTTICSISIPVLSDAVHRLLCDLDPFFHDGARSPECLVALGPPAALSLAGLGGAEFWRLAVTRWAPCRTARRA